MVSSIIVAFTEAALKITSILGLDGGLRRVEWIHGGRRVIKHGGGRRALREGLEEYRERYDA
jgi:hypothetical protein